MHSEEEVLLAKDTEEGKEQLPPGRCSGLSIIEVLPRTYAYSTTHTRRDERGDEAAAARARAGGAGAGAGTQAQ